MRILYVVHNFPPLHWAGTEVYAYNLAQQMASSGHEVYVYTGEWEDMASNLGAPGDLKTYDTWSTEMGNINIRYIVVPRPKTHIDIEDISVDKDFMSFIKEIKPNVVHIHHLIGLSIGIPHIARKYPSALVSTIPDYWYLCPRGHLLKGVWEVPKQVEEEPDLCVLPHSKRCPECLTPYKGDLLRNYIKAALFSRPQAGEIKNAIKERKKHLSWAAERLRFLLFSVTWSQVKRRNSRIMAQLNSFDIHICPSRFLMEKYAAAGLDRNKMLYSDYGMRHFDTVQKESKGYNFVFIGSPVRHKGVHVLINGWNTALKMGISSDAHLTIYGSLDADRPYSDLLMNMAGERVKFAGSFENIKVPEVLAGADVVIVPSIWYENSPLIIHEAFIAGKPLIVSDLGGMRELVKESGAGLLFNVGDAEDLAEKILWADSHRQAMADLAKKTPHVKTIAENAKEIEGIYRSILNKKQR